MCQEMLAAYAKLLELAGMEQQYPTRNLNRIIKKVLSDFVKDCQCPAIWAYGIHTRMLMADYIFELKPVKYIIDEFRMEDAGGYAMIRSGEISDKRIDGIIISSFKYRKEIAETIETKFPQVKYLDIYQSLHQCGIDLDSEYYAQTHPYTHYTRINRLKRELEHSQSTSAKKDLYWELLKELVWIKDFPSAIACVEAYGGTDSSAQSQELMRSLQRVYQLELCAASAVSEKNVLMLCIDGLRRKDLFAEQMKKIKTCIDRDMFFFTNTYSVSTSTFESLIPTYSENEDLRTKYYEQSSIQETDCRFVREAIQQGRRILFYTDGYPYVESSHVQVQEQSRTAAEKIWDFLLDAVDEENGLFYVHILYESHFSYPNPRTEKNLIADGTSIFFDFLPRGGGKLRTDYEAQKRDSMQYLDDLLAPFLERLHCPMVLFADHGSCILKETARMEDVNYPQLTFGEELIQIPLAIRSKEMGIGESHQICSLMDLNEIVIHLLRRERPEEPVRSYIKVLRSEIYNEDFKYLYRELHFEQGLKAFEAFLFQDGWKLVVYDDGVLELYSAAGDIRVEDDAKKEALLAQVREDLTVFNMVQIEGDETMGGSS